MASFSVISLSGYNPELAAKIVAAYGPANSLLVSSNCWLVADNAITTKEVSDKLEITKDGGGGVVGQAIVLRIESFFGFAASNIWERLNAKGKTI